MREVVIHPSATKSVTYSPCAVGGRSHCHSIGRGGTQEQRNCLLGCVNKLFVLIGLVTLGRLGKNLVFLVGVVLGDRRYRSGSWDVEEASHLRRLLRGRRHGL